MKILHFAHSLGSSLDSFINNEINYQSEIHDVRCVCLQPINDTVIPKATKMDFKRGKIANAFYARLYQNDILLYLKNKTFKKQLNQLLEEFQPDVIHCHFAFEALTLLDNYNGKIPVVVHFHGYGASKCLKRKSYIRKLNSHLQRSNVYSICVSEYMEDNLRKNGVNIGKPLILYYGINMSYFKPQLVSLNNNKFTFLQVSTLVQKKGIDITLRAFSEFLKGKNASNYQLILTGDNKPELDYYKSYAAELKINNQVVFYGRANHTQVLDLMSNAKVFVHHSITPKDGDKEGIPNAIIEAMAMKLPILSTVHSGIPELVEDGVNGYLVPEGNVELYVKRMNDILSWELLDKNRKVIELKFNYDTHNKILISFYKTIIGA